MYNKDKDTKFVNDVVTKDKAKMRRNSKMKEQDSKISKMKKWPVIKWFLAFFVLLSGIVFVSVNNYLCYNTHETKHKKYKDATVVYLNSDSVCEQKFKGYDGTLQEIRLYMDNQGRENATGSIALSIRDESNNIIGTTSKNMNEIQTRKYAHFVFDTQPQLEQGKIYTMIISCVDAENPQNFGIYTTTRKNTWLTTGIIDGVSLAKDEKIAASFIFRYYAIRHLAFMLAMMIFGLIFLLIPFGRIEKFINQKCNKIVYIERWLSRAFFVIAPFVAYFMMESLSGYSMREILEFLGQTKGVLNLALYAVLMLVFYAITNRTQYAAILLWSVTLVFGLTNYFVFAFRGIPVLASDILSIGTALNVADSFEYTYDICILWAVSIFAAFTGMMLSLKPYRGFEGKKRIGVLSATIIVVLFANYFYISSDNVSKLGIVDSQWKPQLTYAKNGSMLSFTTSWKYVKTEKPEAYSVNDVKEIAKKYESDATDTSAAKNKKMPNVIAIMNESLADLNADGNISTSEDYMPFLRNLEENTIKGNLYVSIEGANTANSEFEFLTGNSMAFFAPRSVPYNNYVKGVVPSLTRVLKAQGYEGNNAFHPYKRSGWNRENVYNSLGFGHFYSDNYYKNADFIRNFISDKSDMEQIIHDFEKAKKKSDDPFYLFNVTVQNHGGYVGNRGFVDANIEVLNKTLKSDEVEQYLTLVKQSDEAFELLIQYFETVEEPTVIVMFGDHQPPLSNDFYSELFGTKLENFTVEQTATWYSTPYVIWANYDIEEKQNFDMSANYLSSYLLELIGADMTGYHKYLLDLRDKLPVITGLFYQGDDGVFRDIDEESGYSELIHEYAKIQYNGLFDQKNRVDEFFFLEGGDYPLNEDENE